MSKLRLTLSCWNYDRVRALADGRVQPEGIDLNFLDLSVEETFFRMLRNREFDAAELSLSSALKNRPSTIRRLLIARNWTPLPPSWPTGQKRSA